MRPPPVQKEGIDMTTLETQGLAAKNAERVLAAAGTAKKNAA